MWTPTIFALAAIASTIQARAVPNQLDIKTVVLDHIASLSPAGKADFYAHQAHLASLLPNFADVEKHLERQRKSRTRTLNDEALQEASFIPAAHKRALKGITCTKITSTPAAGLTGYSTCLADTPTAHIDDPQWGLQLGTTTKWADGHVPPSLRGIFYMEGNPFPDTAFSTGRAQWNAQLGVFEIPSYAPKTWASDNTSRGASEQDEFRVLGSVLRNECAQNYLDGKTANGTICRTNNFLKAIGINFSWGDYWSTQISENYHIRTTYEPFIPNATFTGTVAYSYNLWRIVDDKGKRTPYYQSRFLVNLGNNGTKPGYGGQQNIHLGTVVLVPQAY